VPKMAHMHKLSCDTDFSCESCQAGGRDDFSRYRLSVHCSHRQSEFHAARGVHIQEADRRTAHGHRAMHIAVSRYEVVMFPAVFARMKERHKTTDIGGDACEIGAFVSVASGAGDCQASRSSVPGMRRTALLAGEAGSIRTGRPLWCERGRGSSGPTMQPEARVLDGL
jgi:hypothetical protein